ncbi:hypothetical protein [Acinetobacter sp. ANC 3832]|uniref:hypothetical protein n=1 Tax=Acinetobacter sp. ANC 3832 TaxID=1977874 RepID=UPI000A33DF2F|nr:hypothetical protein [Acinetobacter sp. ANC 3832]OTG95018.1 hypothetical protein B9T35_06560 [Acinetobacter sp. ANC 3832]
MNSQFKKQPEFRQQQSVQSFYEPALRVLNEVYEIKRANLKRRGYNQDNAAVTKEELSQKMAYRFKITIWLAHEIITSLIKADKVKTFGGYVQPKIDEAPE